MSLNIKRVQLTENGIAKDVDILTSAECVTFEDGDTLQAKLDNGDLTSSDVLGDVDSLNGSVVDSLNELNDSAKETSELVSELANRGGVTSALRKEELKDWVSVSTLPHNFYHGCVVVYNGEIHLLGGSGVTPYTNHYKYNGTSWESVSTLPHDFYRSSAVVLDGEIHILGSNNSNYRTAHYKWDGTSWTSVSTLPYNFYYGSAVVLDGEIHILGSANSSYYKAHYKWDGISWTYVRDLPYNFYYGSAVVLNDEIHILGGGSSSYDNYHYKWNGSSWESVSTLSYTFTSGCAVVYNGRINILGSTRDNASAISHHSFKLGTFLNGYSKANTEIYLPISTTPCTSNLTAIEDGYTVTEDGYVEILINE